MTPRTAPPAASAASASDAHQPDAAAAIHQADAGFRQPVPECLRGDAVCRIVAGTGATEYGDGMDVRHGMHVARLTGTLPPRFVTGAGNIDG